jgi:hypothetical protein
VNFELSGDNGFRITLPGCTKMCCDSNFSSTMKEMLAQVESYSIKEKNLILNVYGWGWINLKLND